MSRFDLTYAEGIINWLVDETSVCTAAPDKCAVLSSRVDQIMDGYAQFCGTRSLA